MGCVETKDLLGIYKHDGLAAAIHYGEGLYITPNSSDDSDDYEDAED